MLFPREPFDLDAKPLLPAVRHPDPVVEYISRLYAEAHAIRNQNRLLCQRIAELEAELKRGA